MTVLRMKKLIAVMIIGLILLSSLFSATAFAASADFEIEDGVLLRYSGRDTDVVVPDGVTVIGASAFEGNTTVKSVTLPASVYSVSDRAFYGCSALGRVNGGTSVSGVGVFAFRGTPYFDNAADAYFILGHTLLWYNGPSTNATLPSGCVSIAPYAFANFTNLRYFRADDGLVSIGAGAFYNCSQLSVVVLPSTLSDVGAYAFDGTPYLGSLGDFATVGDGVLIKYSGAESSVVIPDRVRRIAANAFGTLSKLRSVTVPSSVYSIDAYAFADCVNLTTLSLSDGLVNIGDGAFRGCKSLTRIETPSTLSYIGQYAFRGDAALSFASILGDQLTISYHAFKDCTGLRCVLLSDGVKALYDDAFNGCTALEGISIPPEALTVSASALSGCDRAVVSCEASSNAYAALAGGTVNTIRGDVDGDDDLNIIDATIIQGYLAHLVSFNGAQIAAADLDFDGEINIIDATEVQLRIAYLK